MGSIILFLLLIAQNFDFVQCNNTKKGISHCTTPLLFVNFTRFLKSNNRIKILLFSIFVILFSFIISSSIDSIIQIIFCIFYMYNWISFNRFIIISQKFII